MKFSQTISTILRPILLGAFLLGTSTLIGVFAKSEKQQEQTLVSSSCNISVAFTDPEVMAAKMANPTEFMELIALMNDPKTTQEIMECSSNPEQWGNWIASMSNPTKTTNALAQFMNSQMYANWMAASMNPQTYQPMYAYMNPAFYMQWMTVSMNPTFYQPMYKMMNPSNYQQMFGAVHQAPVTETKE